MNQSFEGWQTWKINVWYQHLTYCTVKQGEDVQNLETSKLAQELETI